MPSGAQIDTLTDGSAGSSVYTATFNPVIGGIYINNILNDSDATGTGRWWASDTYGDAGARYFLWVRHTDNILKKGGDNRRARGLYIRCVSSS